MKRIKIFKYVSIIILTLFLASFYSRTAYADTDTGNFTYNTSIMGIIVTGYTGNDSSITIPKELNGQTVVGIGNNAFSSNAFLVSIIIPDSITKIGDNAFRDCPNLSSIRFKGDAPFVGEMVFLNCSSNLKIYYDASKDGFSNPWNGFPTEVYISQPEVSPGPGNTSVTGIQLNQTSATLLTGNSLSLVPVISPAEAVNKSVSWSSNNPAVAMVDTTGTVTAVGEGIAIITATSQDGGFTAACSINVSNFKAIPDNEIAIPQNYDAMKLSWTKVQDATGYDIYRSNSIDGEFVKIASVLVNEFKDTGLKTDTDYFYKIRAYRTIKDNLIYSADTPVFKGKTLDKSIGSSLFLYMSDLKNRNSVLQKAVALHYGDPNNTCAITVSEALRRIGINIPNSICRTNQVEDHLAARGWKREMNLNLLQPGDICFTTDKYGNLLGGHSTHTFIFMGWANKEKTLMNICDNQTGRYKSVLHERTIYRSSITDATAFFYHTGISSVTSILKLPSSAKADPIAFNKVKITWNTADGAYGYKIYRATSKYGIYSYIASTRNQTYTDTSLKTGNTYYYKVRAYNYKNSLVIYGNYSQILSAAPVLSTPSANLTSVAKGKIKLNWKAVSGANGYQVYRSASKNGSYTRVSSTSYTSITNTGLVSGRVYYYKIRAFRNIGKTKVYSKYSYQSKKAL